VVDLPLELTARAAAGAVTECNNTRTDPGPQELTPVLIDPGPLIISIRAPGVDVDLYSAVESQIQVPIVASS
jgi:hypothetical protein